ncbi:MAG: hypothetical protein ACIARR_10940 [Phycisphaerales bacterium JB059]
MPHRLLPLVLLALLTPILLAQPDLYPDSPAGHAAQRWFDAVRSGNPDHIRDLIENHFDPDFRDRVGVEQHLARHTALAAAGLNAPHSVAHATDHDITLFLRDGGIWGELRISVNPQPPHAITNVGVRPSQGPPDAWQRPTSPGAFTAEMTEFLDALQRTQGFEGAVIIAPVFPDNRDAVLVWRGEDMPMSIPMTMILDQIKLITPLMVLDASWDERHPADAALNQPAAISTLELQLAQDRAHIRAAYEDDGARKAARDHARALRHAQYQQLARNAFAGDSQPQLEYQRGLINTLVLEPYSMYSSEVPLGTTGRLDPADLTRFGRGLHTPELTPPAIIRDMTTGVGPDLDPSPTITRRAALGFEERIDHTPEGDIRSFSVGGESDTHRVLLRCYPTPGYVVVIAAPDQRALDLIDRRIFTRLPGLDPAP